MSNDSESYIINRNNKDSALAILSKHFHPLKSKNYHKFTVLNGAIFNREQVLSSLINQVVPHFILPIKYENDGKGNTQFLSAYCWYAVRVLMANNLLITIPELNVQVELEIHLDYTSGKEMVITPMDVIQMAFKRRVVQNDFCSSLDASNFESDEMFSVSNNIYFPLWVPQFQRILVQATQNFLYLKHLNFSRNKITSLTELSKLNFPKLEELDLRHNKIKWDNLIPIQPDKVKVLWLEGNPLCNTGISEYINTIKALYPQLEKLDGVTVYPESDMTYIMRNSFVNISSHLLVDQFLHHYFYWFLKPEGRNAMVFMYHKDASLSISCNVYLSMDNSINMFQFMSRNILKISNYGKAEDSFQTGLTHISFVLSSLPYLELDPVTTTVDVPYYIENEAMQICFNGLFRDKHMKMFWIGFIFLLRSIPYCKYPGSDLQEWKIVNQMISITTATPEQCKKAFKNEIRKLDLKKFEPTREDILAQFKELTHMKSTWCENFLESTRWDLESALQSFVDQYKGDLVPEDAFNQS